MGATYWSGTAPNVKNLNRHVVVDMVRFTPGGITRAELARTMGLTRAAVSVMINDLLISGLVREAEAHHVGGRKPIVLEINPDQGFVVGIDAGATHATLILTDFSGREIKVQDTPFNIADGPQACLGQLDDCLKTLLDSAGLRLHQVSASGLGVPGPVVAEAGMVSWPPIMPGWDGFPIRDHLQQLWNCHVSVDNDADLGALGEWVYGAARGERNVVYIKVGTGVGCGILIDGKIYRGVTGSAGEIGHITIDENGPVCRCGNRGCLEAIVGGGAIATQAISAIQKGQRTLLAEIRPVERITSHDVISAASRGDLFAQQLIMEAGSHLGTAVAGLVNLFNPGMIVIGGGMAQIGDLLLEPIRQAVLQRSLKMASRAVRITVAVLGRRSSGMGAVVQALSFALHQAIAGVEKEVIKTVN